jgi:signal transduction histidine kinase
VLLRPPRSTGFLHLAFALQAAVVLVLLALNPNRDFLTSLFAVQCYQAAVVFWGRMRVVWVALLVSLTGASLVLQLGLLHGLALSLVPMAAGIVLSTYAVVSRELEAARAGSERMVADLQAAQEQLHVYTGQVDELAAIEERSRLARELRDSVSGTLANVLAASAATRQSLDDPESAAEQLERLQALTQQALAQMREIISELRPAAS